MKKIRKELIDFLEKTTIKRKLGYNTYTSYSFYEVRKIAKLNDGFCLSIQASAGHYCSPRENGLEIYESFEIGNISNIEELLLPYIEGGDPPIDSVYAYVPIQILEAIILKHGGFRK